MYNFQTYKAKQDQSIVVFMRNGYINNMQR